tara:strand:+ start:29134 stop:30729 length:1596 start_codon:yes stop_codon:yes gene_type:complete
MSKMLQGTPILHGDNTIPGVPIPREIQELMPTIVEELDKWGLDYYPPIIEMLEYDQMSEVAAYGGFPVRYPHWKWGMEYDELARGYEFGYSKIYEMVVNTSPYCYIYCLHSNDLIDNVTVIIHALGHSDFFKNNIFFEPTDGNMMNQLADNGARIRKYMARWGKDRVTKFIDHVLRISTLIDPFKAWDSRKINEVVVRDTREVHHPRRLRVDSPYMEDWINTKEWLEAEKERISKADIRSQLDIFGKPVRDIFGFIKDYADFKPWQQDIISILYDETMYFSPQGATKMLNEGWASMVDYKLGACEGLVALGQKAKDMGIIHYAKHKMGVLGGKYSQNPYKLGFELLSDIEERWDKGMFGPEWEECDDIKRREDWDKKLGLGKKKIFEVRANYNDYTALLEFFTPEFCEKMEYYETKWFPTGETKIDGREFKAIKSRLLQRYLNRGLPDIRLVDPNHRNNGWLLMQHFWDDRPLYDPYCREAITSLYALWGDTVLLETRTMDGDEIIFVCEGEDIKKDVVVLSREEYESTFK